MGRVQSPSSIKTYKHCPRKYYYTYIEKRPTPPNIHMVRGNIAHSVLEYFFDMDTSLVTMENFTIKLKSRIQELLVEQWGAYKEKLEEVGITKEQKIFYFEETLLMLLNWTNQFCKKIEAEQGIFPERFKKLTPVREQEYKSDTYAVRGFIDAIEKLEAGIVRLMDYKTDKKFDLNRHKLQLAIYALLYYDKHQELPTHLGIYFLKGNEQVVAYDETLLAMAKREIAYIHEVTETNDKNEYPKSPGPLCKWRTGQCEHYDVCRPFG